MNIRSVAVIGAGLMGRAIAAHFANAGTRVLLLDIVPPGASNRNALAEAALKALDSTEPQPLMRKANAKRITPGNVEDHLEKLAEVDWVIEAIVEDVAAKQDLYRRLHAVCRPDAAISSNTSALRMQDLVRDMPAGFAERFLITHFFNPPRYMRLLELAGGSATRPELLEAIGAYADRQLGKECVVCKDTPGFIANRIGLYWLQKGLLEALRMGIAIEEADAVLGTPLGIPKAGVFGLFDLVGIDLVPHVLESMRHALPADDPFRELDVVPPVVTRLIADGYTGRKGKGGFYRLNRTDGGKVKEALDLVDHVYRPARKPQLECIEAARRGGLRGLLSCSDQFAEYAWRVVSGTFNYAASLVSQIADDVAAVDTAFRLGFNWDQGPFEMLDRIGIDWYVDRLIAEHREVPAVLRDRRDFYRVAEGQREYRDFTGRYRPLRRPEGVLLLAYCKLRHSPVLANGAASLWDIGDGAACLELHGKLNTLDGSSLEMIEAAAERVRGDFGALVIYGEVAHFSAGANLKLLLGAIDRQDWATVERLVVSGQQAYRKLKYAPFPVIGAPSGFAFGGGCEMLLHCDAIQAHAELYMGLVETGVGLIPAWGGCKEFLRRCLAEPKRLGGPIPPLAKAFETIGLAKTSGSAFEARDLGFLASTDGITMNKSRLLADAKARALAMTDAYDPPEPPAFHLAGAAGRIALELAIKGMRLTGKATAYDGEIGSHLARVLSGGSADITQPLSEDDLLALERDAFMALVRRPETRARIEYMLTTGRPLRN